MARCKFYLRSPNGSNNRCLNPSCRLKKCWFTDPQNECECFEPTEENKKESKNMIKCKYYAETARRGWCSNVDCLLERCDDFNNCDCSESAVRKEEPEVVKKFKENLDQIISVKIEHIGVGDLKECRFVRFARVIDNCLGNFIVIDCTTDKVFTYSHAEYSWKEVPREVSKVTSLDDKVRTEKLTLDNSRSMDATTLTIQNCDKIILKPKSLEVEVKIEKDNFDDFDYIVVNGHKFKKV